MDDHIDADASFAYQAVEFLDIPPMDEALTEPPEHAMHLSDRSRSSLTTSARAYIEGLVESYHGDADDVRSIIGALDAR
jgi:hypothetical protein